MTSFESDTLQRYLDLLVATLDTPLRGDEAAHHLYLSRFHLDRLIRSIAGESPGAMRRRVLLERAAYQLTNTDMSITAVAMEASYSSAGSFARAFKSAFGHLPSHHRDGSQSLFTLRSPNGIHFHPPAGLWLPSGTREEKLPMDLLDRLLRHDLHLTRRILEAAKRLTDEQLDAPMDLGQGDLADVTATTLRQLLERLVFTKELWGAAMEGAPCVEKSSETVADLQKRWEVAGTSFARVVKEIRDSGKWDDTLVRTNCDPPETFTFGGAVAHVVTFTDYRRSLALGVLGSYGIHELGYGDPMDLED